MCSLSQFILLLVYLFMCHLKVLTQCKNPHQYVLLCFYLHINDFYIQSAPFFLYVPQSLQTHLVNGPDIIFLLHIGLGYVQLFHCFWTWRWFYIITESRCLLPKWTYRSKRNVPYIFTLLIMFIDNYIVFEGLVYIWTLLCTFCLA